MKNDFIVWGARETVENNTIPIRYHLAIDSKPVVGNTYYAYFYPDPDAINLADLKPITKARVAIDYEFAKDFPAIGEIGRIYYDKTNNKAYYWGVNKKEEISKDRYLTYFQDNDFNVCYATYRSLIYGEIFNVKPNTIFYSQGPGYLYGEWKSWNNDFIYEMEYSDYLLRKVVINYGLGKKYVTTLEFDNVKIEIPN